MEELLKWIKANVKEGVDFSKAEELIKKENPLVGLEDVEEAKKLIKKTAILSRAFDSEQSIAAEKVIKNFKEDKLPAILKENSDAVRKELNPDLTDEQKRIKDLEEKLQAQDSEAALSKLRSQLAAEAKDLGFDPEDAKDFAVYGEKASEKLKKFAEKQSKFISEQVSTKLKDEYHITPPVSNPDDQSVKISRQEFDALNPMEQASLSKETVIVD